MHSHLRNFWCSLVEAKVPLISVKTSCCLMSKSMTGSNLRNLRVETGLDPRKDVPKMKKAILDSKCPVPEMDTWRNPCLQKYLALRYTLELQGEDKSVVPGGKRVYLLPLQKNADPLHILEPLRQH